MIATAQDVQAAVTIAAVATAGIVIGAVWPYALALVAMALRTAGATGRTKRTAGTRPVPAAQTPNNKNKY
ncbi:hypothetical protein [Actinomyces urogenitalis]|uniref:hypothetical protein n=1 Tax=Actinomyces urogenitalis TaxID=103621 RepID=UPI00254D36A5|nr:hypothetical protein [Actinomyces urogenitalis]MDK8237927.1 hypothetical protein [Actinomyces urogenitalis]WOO94334.1 hypothetical protein R3I39_06340 [Actinomyces urogenitalis]